MLHIQLLTVSAGQQGPADRYPVTPDLALVIGRDVGCNIRVDESHDVVSRRHLTVRWDGESLVVNDSSSNGVFVNGQRVQGSQPVFDEDEIQLGPGGPVFTVALDPKPPKPPPPARETRLIASTRPQPTWAPLPRESVASAPAGPAAPAPQAPDAQAAVAAQASEAAAVASEALQNMARGGKQLLSGAAASIKGALEDRARQRASSPAASSRSSSPSFPGGFMLSRLVVQLYKIILEIALWIFLLVGLVAGWQYNGLWGALVGLVLVALVSAVFFGAFLVLGDIRQSVRVIEDKMKNRD